ncbi:peptidyl-tRNA hydrolase 2, mitochondrial-like [Convolutriloba macropyga]|uniref:peptidyl-tRNA hydrolase 2, mitochondrial-like n=1 Tax=Convolutriloba macropyga TaxID=536237 RepID=UPI003F524003
MPDCFQFLAMDPLMLIGGIGLGFVLGNKLRLHSIRRVISGVVSKYYYPHSPPNKSVEAMKGELKLVVAVRMDLKMGKGKIAAQCAHGALKAYLISPDTLKQSWTFQGQTTVVTQIDSLEELRSLFEKGKSLGLPVAIIRDAGRTQVARGTETVVAIGPGPISLVDQVTGKLPLMK